MIGFFVLIFVLFCFCFCSWFFFCLFFFLVRGLEHAYKLTGEIQRRKKTQIIDEKKLWMEQGPTGGDKKQNQETALERKRLVHLEKKE